MNRGGSTSRGRGQRQSWRPITANSTLTAVGADVASNGHMSGSSDRRTHGSWQAVRHGAGGSLSNQHENVTPQVSEGQRQRSSCGGGVYSCGGRGKQQRISYKNYNNSNHSYGKSVGPSSFEVKHEGNDISNPVDEVIKPLSEGESLENVTPQVSEGQIQRSSCGGGVYSRGGRGKQQRTSYKSYNNSNHSYGKSVGPSSFEVKHEGNDISNPVDEVIKPLSEGESLENVTPQVSEGQRQRSSCGGGVYSRGGWGKQQRTSYKNYNNSNHSYGKSVGPSSFEVQHEGNDISNPVDEVIKPLSEGESESSSLNLDQSFLIEVASSHVETNNRECAENVRMSENSVSSIPHEGFDICPSKSVSGVVLKPSLLSKNREKRNDLKRSIVGPKGTILRSGMVLLKNFLSSSDQVEILRLCRIHGMGPAGFYQPHFHEGGKMHLRLMCFGEFWDPETSRYGEVRLIDGAKPPPVPQVFLQLVDRAIHDAHTLIAEDSRIKKVEDVLPLVKPDICLVNYYATTGKLGLHQDKDESQESLGKRIPIVSFSIGDSAEFLYNDQRNVETAQKITLESGDVLIFGGRSRHIFHGVSTILPDTAPKSLLEETNFRPGRINLTFRQRF